MATDDDKTITFALEPMTDGYPALVDDAFRAAVRQGTAGGKDTQDFFDALNATSDFWSLLASGGITFAPGVDPKGRPILMASSGNVDLRVQAVYAGPTGDGAPQDDHPALGIVTVATRNTTTSASGIMAVLARVATMPVYLPITADLFKKLLVPLYSNTKTLLGNTADALSRATSTETPDVDAIELSDAITIEQNEVIEDVAEELGEQGIEYMAIDWAAVGLDVAGLAPLMAIPMIFEYLGHKMTHSLIVQNMSGVDFALDLSQIHGAAGFHPGTPKLPKVVTQTDPLDPPAENTYSYAANYQFINSSDYGDIGYVLTLTPGDGSPVGRVLVSVPWAGDNTVWTGRWDGDIGSLWEQHSKPTDALEVSADFGSYKVTLSLNALAGTTENDTYFYCSMALIE